MNEIEEIMKLISQINSPWQLLGFLAVLGFAFGCLWILYKIITSVF